MTLATALYGGGGVTKYRSGNLYLAMPGAIGSDSSSANTDYIVPYSPRRLLTVDKVAWYRDNTTAANVYVGLYSSAGTLLTDCAVDTDTTVGWHLVDTTNITLTAGDFYWLCWNASVDVAGTQSAFSSSTAIVRAPYEDYLMEYGIAVGIGITSTDIRGTAQAKTRTNAALLSTLTMSGFNQNACAYPPALGVVPA